MDVDNNWNGNQMNNFNYQLCNNCIMDTSDTTLTFDERGWCNYCCNFHKHIAPNWYPGERGIQEINPIIDKIKREGAKRDHDCLIGVSGGLDSSYVAYIAKEKFGLRPLLFHCDTGWNSDLGVSNIQKVVDGLGLDLVTEVINWEEMKDLQRAFFRAQVPFVDTPQDLGLFSAFYNFAAKNGFKYVITGGNNSTESVRESLEWTYFSTDMRHVYDLTNVMSGPVNRVAVVPAGHAVRFDRAVRKNGLGGSSEYLFGEITIRGRTYPMNYYLTSDVYPDAWRRMYGVFEVRER